MSFSKSQGKKQDSNTSSVGSGGGGHGSHVNNNNNNQQKQQKYRGSNTNNNNNNNSKKWGSNAPSRNNSNQSPTLSNDTIAQDPAMVKLMHDRMLCLLGNLTGTMVEATTTDGTKFKGIFHGASTEGDLGVALKFAQKTFDPTAAVHDDQTKTMAHPIKNTLMIFSKDLVELHAIDVDFTLSETSFADRHTFKTDTDISGKMDFKERELHKWAPASEDENNALGLLDGDLESSGSGSWDQFAANEKLFGLKTDFDEEIYTTTLDRSAPGYKDREKRAIKMANAIQKTSTTNVHMLEERGIAIDDSGMDEEDLYGAVVRDANPNKYVPPALRKLQQQQQQQQQQPKKTTSPLNKLITSDLPKAAGLNPSPIANLPTTRREPTATTEKSTTTGEPPKRIEAEIATTFKHFAMMEKDKLHAKKQALQKKEKDGRLAELKAFHQSFKLNVPIPADLVPLLSKGGASKKLPASSPSVESSEPAAAAAASPTSLSPASTVDDKNKKISTVTKPASTSTTTPVAVTSVATTTVKPSTSPVNPPAATKTTTASPSASPASTNKTAATTTTTTTASFKFNVKASSFKPNPSAAAFVPGNGGNTADKPPTQRHKRGGSDHLTMTEAFIPFFVDKEIAASAVGPTWPFGNKSYRVQFSQFVPYEEDVYTGYPSPNYGSYGYPQYSYPQYVRGMPPMAVQQGPYMNPQFVQNVPISAPMPPNGGPPVYSPQMANISPHGSPFPQGFPSPQRSPMVPQGMPPQVYQYQGGPMMMRYPPEMMQNNGGPPPPPPSVMMGRPVMVEAMPYPPQHHQQQPQQQQQQQQQQNDTSANDSGTETPPPN